MTVPGAFDIAPDRFCRNDGESDHSRRLSLGPTLSRSSYLDYGYGPNPDSAFWAADRLEP